MESPKKPEQQPILIEEAHPDDVAGIIDVQKETWLITYPNEEAGISEEDIRSINFSASEKLTKWKQRIETSESSKVFVAKAGTTIVGFCCAVKGDDRNDLQALYILPAYQGKSIGTKLMTTALDWLRSDKDISVYVAEYNEPAIEFYERHGFKKTDKIPASHKIPNGKMIPEIEMLKTFKH